MAKNQSRDWLKKNLDYIKKNFQLIIKGCIAMGLLVLGPFLAMSIRLLQDMNLIEGNWGLILSLGLVFEIIGIITFWFLIKNDYLKIEEDLREKSLKKKQLITEL